MRALYFVLLFLLMVYSSCRKEKDELSPKITWVLPGEFEVYHVFDTIRFEFEAQDESKLESIVVDIADNQFRSVLSGIEINQPNTNLLRVAREIVIDDIHLNSGDYFIRVRISDGENEKVDFRPCTIIEEPLQIKRFIAYKNNGLSTQIDTLNFEGGNWEFAATHGFESNFAVSNSWHQELALAHAVEGQLSWLDAADFSQINFQQLPSPGGNQFWRDFYFDYDKLVYLGSTEDGFIRTFKPGGISGITITVPENFRAGKLKLHGNLLYAELQSINNQNKQIAVFQFNTGVYQQSRNLEIDIVEIIPVNADEVLLFGNDSDGNGIVLPYFNSANAEGFPLNLNLSEITAAARDEFGNYLVSTTNEIRKFSYDGNGTFSVSGNILDGVFEDLKFEPVSTMFSALHDGAIVFISPQLTISESILLPAGTERYNIVYNK